MNPIDFNSISVNRAQQLLGYRLSFKMTYFVFRRRNKFMKVWNNLKEE